MSVSGAYDLFPEIFSSRGGGNTLLGHGGGAGELNLYYGLDPSQENTDYDPTLGEQFINV